MGRGEYLLFKSSTVYITSFSSALLTHYTYLPSYIMTLSWEPTVLTWFELIIIDCFLSYLLIYKKKIFPINASTLHLIIKHFSVKCWIANCHFILCLGNYQWMPPNCELVVPFNFVTLQLLLVRCHIHISNIQILQSQTSPFSQKIAYVAKTLISM